MNTGEVAKLLGVSPSTIQRWVKQLDLPMERNDRGHYTFTEMDINLLRTIQDQVQKGILLQEIAAAKETKVRKGSSKLMDLDLFAEKISLKVSELERGLSEKADSVASYQLLQHRSEIEELQTIVQQLCQRFELFEKRHAEEINKENNRTSSNLKPKKKNFIIRFFGL